VASGSGAIKGNDASPGRIGEVRSLLIRGPANSVGDSEGVVDGVAREV